MLLLLLATFAFHFNTNSALAESIMLTAFKAKAGNQTNITPALALRVKQLLEAEGHTVTICLLPIVYDLAAEKAQECYQNISPTPHFVTSLGEGDCEFSLETRAANLDDDDSPDDAGKVRIKRIIQADLPPQIRFRFPWQGAYCSLDRAEKERVTPSNSAGGYVCNNTAFHLASKLPRSVPYGFLHVPDASCPNWKQDKIKDAALVAKLLTSVLNSKMRSSITPEILPQDCISEYLQKQKDNN